MVSSLSRLSRLCHLKVACIKYRHSCAVADSSQFWHLAHSHNSCRDTEACSGKDKKKCKTWHTKMSSLEHSSVLFSNLIMAVWSTWNPKLRSICFFCFSFIGTGLVWRGRGDHHSICGAFCNIANSYSQRYCRCLAGKFRLLCFHLCFIL